jgi:hypothetical protein
MIADNIMHLLVVYPQALEGLNAVTVVCAYHYLLLLYIYVIADDVMHLLVVCVQAREGLNAVTVVCA